MLLRYGGVVVDVVAAAAAASARSITRTKATAVRSREEGRSKTLEYLQLLMDVVIYGSLIFDFA